ncbi:hypothetical protein AVEN_202673-1 [Araneus ventricosus]|uniref:Uncharacterized protein n=1 Tax=Araneus ventricosus TaxID=182803 RepID=A0A4Y2MN35_ARAVE|nr:hypothetical protein AVEN_202673-1 [Araneus ventricosus]
MGYQTGVLWAGSRIPCKDIHVGGREGRTLDLMSSRLCDVEIHSLFGPGARYNCCQGSYVLLFFVPCTFLHLIYLELNSRRKALVNVSWRHPPAHSWYRSEGPGAAIHFKGDRKDQTALARLSSGHLKTLRFSPCDKTFNICTKCNMIEATPQHLLDCVALVYDDLLKRPDFVLEVMRANDLMDLI